MTKCIFHNSLSTNRKRQSKRRNRSRKYCDCRFFTNQWLSTLPSAKSRHILSWSSWKCKWWRTSATPTSDACVGRCRDCICGCWLALPQLGFLCSWTFCRHNQFCRNLLFIQKIRLRELTLVIKMFICRLKVMDRSQPYSAMREALAWFIFVLPKLLMQFLCSWYKKE